MGKCVEVCVDDMIVKSSSYLQHSKDLAKCSQPFKYNLRLNPKKCVFGVDNEKFLGFMLIQRGIEANPDKCKAIIEIVAYNLKEVQRLVGRLTTISRFLPKLATKPDPLSTSSKNPRSFHRMNSASIFSKISRKSWCPLRSCRNQT